MPNGSISLLRTPEQQSMALLERALDYLAHDNYSFAERILRDRMKKFGEDADGYVQLAVLHSRQNDLEGALELFRKAVSTGEAEIAELEPVEDLWSLIPARAYLRALYGLGLSLLELARFDESLRAFRRVLRLNAGDNLGAGQLVGLVYHRQGRLKEAVSSYRRFRSDPMVAFNLALAHFTRDDHADAVLILRQALLANPYVPAMLLSEPPEPFDYPHIKGTEEPEYAMDYAGSCGDLWETVTGAFVFLRAVIESEPVKSEGVAFRELRDRLGRERRHSEKQKFQTEIRRMASARRLNRTNPAILIELRRALNLAGIY